MAQRTLGEAQEPQKGRQVRGPYPLLSPSLGLCLEQDISKTLS